MVQRQNLGFESLRQTPAGLMVVLAAVIAALGLALRLWQLDQRPMHHDEANQALRAGLLLEDGHYRYDPREHHGPTLYYAAATLLRLVGVRSLAETSEYLLRLVPACFGIILILLPLGFADGLGRSAALTACFLTALSPAMVYYSGFFIQEPLLVCFTTGLLVCGWRWQRRHSPGWAMGVGACIGLMHATKETAVLSWLALAIALAVVLWCSRGPGAPRSIRRALPPPRQLLWAVMTAGGVSLLLYSSFFTHLRGPLDSLASLAGYSVRALGGSGHRHPPWFYLHRLAWFQRGSGPVWSEALILLAALVGALSAWLPRRFRVGVHPVLLRFLCVYTLALLVIYALIPYKTPWCMLSFLQGMILLAGVGVRLLWLGLRRSACRVVLALLFLLGAWRLGQLSVLALGPYAVSPANPYAYAQTGRDVLRLSERLHDLARCHAQGTGLRIHLIAPAEQTWPLPWYLRAFPRVGYWNDATPEALGGRPPILLTAVSPGTALPEPGQYTVEAYGLRPGVLFALHIRADLWNSFLQSRQLTPSWETRGTEEDPPENHGAVNGGLE